MGLCWGATTGGGQHKRKVAAVKRSCKPAATPQGFPTSTQPQLDHPDLRCSNIIHSTTKQTHTQHAQFCGSGRTSPFPVTAVLPGRFSNPYRNNITNLQSTQQVLGTHRAHNHTIWRVRVYGILNLRGYGRGDLDERERCWEGFPL